MGRRLETITIDGVKPSGGRKVTEWEAFHSGFRYSKFKRVRLNGIAGTLFWADSIPAPLRERIEASSNSVLLSSRAEYAPEQISRVVFIGDRGWT